MTVLLTDILQLAKCYCTHSRDMKEKRELPSRSHAVTRDNETVNCHDVILFISICDQSFRRFPTFMSIPRSLSPVRTFLTTSSLRIAFRHPSIGNFYSWPGSGIRVHHLRPGHQLGYQHSLRRRMTSLAQLVLQQKEDYLKAIADGKGKDWTVVMGNEAGGTSSPHHA